VLCVVCGAINIWIGASQLLEGPLVEACLCGIGGLWRSVWGSLLLPAPLEMLMVVFLGLLGVYVVDSDCDRRYLWEELVGFLSSTLEQGLMDLPLIMGTFT